MYLDDRNVQQNYRREFMETDDLSSSCIYSNYSFTQPLAQGPFNPAKRTCYETSSIEFDVYATNEFARFIRGPSFFKLFSFCFSSLFLSFFFPLFVSSLTKRYFTNERVFRWFWSKKFRYRIFNFFFFFIFSRFVSIFEKDHRERQLADKYFSLVLGLRRCGLKGMFEVPI